MKILGISPLDKDATVSIVEDGEILYAAGEERFSRVKQQEGFPSQATQDALSHTGMDPGDFDMVVYPFMEWQEEQKLYLKNIEKECDFIDGFSEKYLDSKIREAQKKIPDRKNIIHGLKYANEVMEKNKLYTLFYKYAGSKPYISKIAAKNSSRQWAEAATSAFKKWEHTLQSGISEFGFASKLKRMDHHLSHAANSFYASGYAEALCVTLDGYGTGLAGSVSEARNGKIRRLHGVEFPNSLGSFYEQVTSSLGFRPSRHEGKIVGLASYGDPEILKGVLLSRIVENVGDFKIFESNNTYFSRYLASKFPKIDVAAAYQRVLEIVATNYISHWIKQTGIDTIVLSGGVTANVKLNQRIFEIEGVNNIFVYPNMGDGGCGTGAALYHSWPGGIKDSISNVYFGPNYSERYIQSELDKSGLQYTKPDNYAGTIAELINEGNVIARFDGRMEYGPRALGNRSILYHAKEPEVNQWLNQRLGRTEFMPFAPVTLFEDRESCYNNIKGAEHTAEFMTITFDCTDEMKRQCPAAVHIDGTARPQLIRKEANKEYYQILKEYKKISGISSLINTSFNMHEEPIVCTPIDAIKGFLHGKIDWLAIGPFLVQHPGNK